MSTDLRIIFMGTPEFAVPALRALIEAGEKVVAVVTQPDRPKGRGRKLTPPPVKVLALEAGIPVLQPTKVRTAAFVEELRAFAPDIMLVAAYGRILPEPVLSLPRLGCVNVHGSLLPKYRGAAPVQWAILNGEPETGITIMQMDAGLDTGDILRQGSLPIAADETTATLAPKLAALGGSLLLEALAGLRQGKVAPRKQDDSQATFARLLQKEDGAVDWRRPAHEISCQLRGLDPWPAAAAFLGDTRLRLFQPRVVEQAPRQPPGTILRVDKSGLLVACGANCLLVQEVQKDGGKRMPLAAFLSGYPIDEGAVFSEEKSP